MRRDDYISATAVFKAKENKPSVDHQTKLVEEMMAVSHAVDRPLLAESGRSEMGRERPLTTQRGRSQNHRLIELLSSTNAHEL